MRPNSSSIQKPSLKAFSLNLGQSLDSLAWQHQFTSQNRLIVDEGNVNDGADLDTKDHLAYVVDEHKTKIKDANPRSFFKP